MYSFVDLWPLLLLLMMMMVMDGQLELNVKLKLSSCLAGIVQMTLLQLTGFQTCW